MLQLTLMVRWRVQVRASARARRRQRRKRQAHCGIFPWPYSFGVFSPCHPSTTEWYLDMAEFAAAFSDRTKVFILNSPQNPTGKASACHGCWVLSRTRKSCHRGFLVVACQVFSPAELTEIAAVIKAQPQRVVVISDEVYEHLTFDGLKHTPFATIPGMFVIPLASPLSRPVSTEFWFIYCRWEHTATVGSSGKTFSVTGWKCGWIVGPEDIVRYRAALSEID